MKNYDSYTKQNSIQLLLFEKRNHRNVKRWTSKFGYNLRFLSSIKTPIFGQVSERLAALSNAIIQLHCEAENYFTTKKIFWFCFRQHFHPSWHLSFVRIRQCRSHFHPHQSLYFSRARSTETGGFNSLGSSVSEPEKEGLRLLLALLMTFSW